MTRSLCLISIFLLASAGFAQSAFNGITVTVTDSQGAVIHGAKVETVSQERHFKTIALTSMAGSCLLPHLPIGKYLVTVTKKGFQKKQVVTEVGVDGVQKIEIQLIEAGK